ncbi:helicase related [Anaeramoeba flamelloides]|uniref:Helicase related n=1 Tax=Anaeramoeba flamelloides TaxID=1746091 RepID=A0ABQ8ZDV1_9EUKA|nr:helicase related [Anaeramoeba flamelloides]
MKFKLDLLWNTLENCFLPLLFIITLILTYLLVGLSATETLSIKSSSPRYSANNVNEEFNNTCDQMLLFLQISGTSISSDYDNKNNENFETFLSAIIPFLQPDFVIHSGDIIEQVKESNSQDFKEKRKKAWQNYSNLLDKYRYNFNNHGDLTNAWYDLRGDQDASGILIKESESNYYYTHSPQQNYPLIKSRSPVVYFNIEKHFGNYLFVFVDFATYPTANYPNSYFGEITPQILNSVDYCLNELPIANQTFLIGHYPIYLLKRISEIGDRGRTMKGILTDRKRSINNNENENENENENGNEKKRNIPLVYLNGHTNSNNMYSHLFKTSDEIPNSLLELSLPHFSKTKTFRILTIDNDLFTFVDYSLQDYNDDKPMIMITNPPDSRFLTGNMPLFKMKYSTEVHVVIYSPKYNITSVECRINDILINNNMQFEKVNNIPIYKTNWEPKDYYNSKSNEITIRVNLNNKQSYSQKNTFSLSIQQGSIGNSFDQIMQRQNLPRVIQILFIFLLFLIHILPIELSFLISYSLKVFSKKTYKKIEKMGKQLLSKQENSFKLAMKTHLFIIFWKPSTMRNHSKILLSISLLLLIASPLYICPLFSDHYGVGFFWGISDIKNKYRYKMNCFNLLFTMFFLIFIFLPSIIIILLKKIQDHCHNEVKNSIYYKKPLFYLCCLILAPSIILLNYYLKKFYHTSGLLLSFSLFYNILLLLCIILDSIFPGRLMIGIRKLVNFGKMKIKERKRRKKKKKCTKDKKYHYKEQTQSQSNDEKFISLESSQTNLEIEPLKNYDIDKGINSETPDEIEKN